MLDNWALPTKWISGEWSGLTGAAPGGKEIGQDQLAAVDDIIECFHVDEVLK